MQHQKVRQDWHGLAQDILVAYSEYRPHHLLFSSWLKTGLENTVELQMDGILTQ